MSFDWKLYVQLAEELIDFYRSEALKEAYFRSAISRAYYGVFCIGRNFLKSKGKTIPPIDTHKFVREQFKRSSDMIERKIGENLARLWKERKDSDYEDTADINRERAKTACELAKRLLQELKKIGAIN
ncbi:MAG: HEPN domain-containing protein [Candidatus Calescibacterium sp.]